VTTEAQLGQEAVDLAQSTSYSWDKFLARVATDTSYTYKNTSWYKAGAKLEQTKHLGGGGDSTPPSVDLGVVQARIFLAQSPLDSLAAPTWMVPVCTADQGYRNWYSTDVISKLRSHFGRVEAWCDCRNPTAYSEAEAMVSEFGLDGAWGQCENQAEWDHAYEYGSRRMVGNITALSDSAKELVKNQTVLLSVELYRNVMPWMLPDWMGCNAGIGGNCIGVYESASEGAVYTSVASYKEAGLYVPKQDSVYGVGLRPEDWANLA
jgi:hypothetical protein